MDVAEALRCFGIVLIPSMYRYGINKYG